MSVGLLLMYIQIYIIFFKNVHIRQIIQNKIDLFNKKKYIIKISYNQKKIIFSKLGTTRNRIEYMYDLFSIILYNIANS